MIISAWQGYKSIKNIMIFLAEHVVSTEFDYRIYKVYSDNSIEKIKENPYSLAEDVYGIGFKTADKIAVKLGFEKDRYFRCGYGKFHVMSSFAEQRHCYVPLEELIKKSVEMLEVEEHIVVMT